MAELSTRVNIDSLAVGMVLAADAVHLNGRVLLREGTCLTEKHMKIFKAWGLLEACVVSSQGDVSSDVISSEIDPVIIQQATAFIQERFSPMGQMSDPAAELFRICVSKYAQQLSVQGD